jgi:hypothetical protein
MKRRPSRQTNGTLIVHILRDVEKFLKNNSMPAAKFGREAVKDPRFVFDLRKGREPGARTVERIRAFLEEQQ